MKNLRRQLDIYDRLFLHFGLMESECTVADVASLLHFTQRHVQTLLKSLSELGWIRWQAESGRSKRATLTCQIEPIQACYQCVDRYADSGNVDQILNLLSFGGRNPEVELKHYISLLDGRTVRQAIIPFHRPIAGLHPLMAKQRTERFLITQICQCLTRIKNGQVTGDLAHQWRASSNGTQWYFYLRRGSQLHDGTPVTAKLVVECLNTLIRHAHWQKEYEHVQRVLSLGDDEIKVELTQPDFHLDRLLAQSQASIFRYHAKRLVGSGAFSLTVCSEKMLRLERFSCYTLNHALLDKVELWVYPLWAQDKVCAHNQVSVRLPEVTAQITGESNVHFWAIRAHSDIKINEWLTGASQPNTDIKVSVENNNESRQLFSKYAGDSQSVSLIEVSYGDYSADVDVRFCSTLEQEDALASALGFFTRFPFSNSLNQEQYQAFSHQLSQIRATKEAEKALLLTHKLISWLVEEEVMTRLHSQRFQLHISNALSGADINGYGWCELANLWGRSSS